MYKKMKKLITLLHGFCMALADSVPGVSGGTIAFLLGFYDQFIGSLNALISGTKAQRIDALKYLVKLGIGWILGFGASVMVLANVFESQIYRVSSLFLGFILFAIPVVIYEERDTLRKEAKSGFFALIGLAIVVGITFANSRISGDGFNLDHPSVWMYLYTFLVGAVAICAMVLPGISGSTLLLIFGLYIPIIDGIHDLMKLNFHMLPILIVFGVGVLTGIVSIIKLIQNALTKHRGAMIYLVLGMMLGSLYSVCMGPTTLETAQPAMQLNTFHILFFLLGGLIIVGMQGLKMVCSKGDGTSADTNAVS
jgi:putative membrane protein